MRVFFIAVIVLVFLGCSNVEANEAKVYSMEDFTGTGVKVKGDFETEFPEVTDAKWGFFKGREVAVFRYPTIELAETLGKTAGQEQIELLDTKEYISYGPKVEKTVCRGDKAPGSNLASGRKIDIIGHPGLENTLGQTIILNKLKLFEIENYPDINNRTGLTNCPRREPIYTEFILQGNLVILGEPSSGEDSEGTIKFLEELADKLP